MKGIGRRMIRLAATALISVGLSTSAVMANAPEAHASLPNPGVVSFSCYYNGAVVGTINVWIVSSGGGWTRTANVVSSSGIGGGIVTNVVYWKSGGGWDAPNNTWSVFSDATINLAGVSSAGQVCRTFTYKVSAGNNPNSWLFAAYPYPR